MRTWRAFLAGAALVGLGLSAGTTPVCAQMDGMGRSLGGFGAGTIASYYQNRSGPLIPYAGGQGGYVPFRGLEARSPIVTAAIPGRLQETTIGGASREMGTPIGGASLRREGTFRYRPSSPSEALGMGLVPGTGGLGPRPRMLPPFGSPFRQPPSLVGGGSGAMGAM